MGEHFISNVPEDLLAAECPGWRRLRSLRSLRSLTVQLGTPGESLGGHLVLNVSEELVTAEYSECGPLRQRRTS